MSDVLFLNDGGAVRESQQLQGSQQPDARLSLDRDATSQDVIARIEQLVTEFITSLQAGRVMPLQLMAMQPARNAAANIAHHLLDQAALESGGTVQDSSGSSQAAAVSLPSSQAPAAAPGRPQLRSLFASNGAGAMAYARVFVVLQAVHELLINGRTATQRDLYYKLQRHAPVIASAKDIDAAIQDVSRILTVPRVSLGVTCASRGAVVGRLYVRDTAASPWQDCCACGSGGKAIPGDISAIASISFQTNASYLLIIEKDAVFQRLSQDRLFDALPVIMVTARGQPDLATRAFCSKLVDNFPLTVLGFVDFNPAGVLILRTYKYGSQSSGLESVRYAMPSLHWLGLHSSWLEDVTVEHLQQLTPRDRSLLPNLKASFSSDNQAIDMEQWEQCEAWVSELEVMEQQGYKADIEAVYSVGGYAGLKDMVVSAVLRQQYL